MSAEINLAEVLHIELAKDGAIVAVMESSEWDTDRGWLDAEAVTADEAQEFIDRWIKHKHARRFA